MSKHIKIWAVDFDGTLCESVWPGIGAPNMKLINYLIRKQKEGVKLILWTCRAGERLQEAVDWCADLGLKFDAVNDNLPEMIALHGGNNCRKVRAARYIDDLAADKEEYHIPFHTEKKPDYSKFDRYPIDSEWYLRCDGISIPVKIVVVNKEAGWIEAQSTSGDGIFKHYSVRREVEWFYDKLFSLGEEKERQISMWIKVSEKLPPEGLVVDTKIDDEKGVRNETELYRKGKLWFLKDDNMYVYYTPTHWKER